METLGSEKVREIFSGCTYLEDSGVTLGSLSVWGSPLSTGASDNNAFQSRYADRVAMIPAMDAYAKGGSAVSSAVQDVDVLITHGPLPADVVREISPKLYVSGQCQPCRF
jgi:hypothetical protein